MPSGLEPHCNFMDSGLRAQDYLRLYIPLQFSSNYPLVSRYNPLSCRLRRSQVNPKPESCQRMKITAQHPPPPPDS